MKTKAAAAILFTITLAPACVPQDLQSVSAKGHLKNGNELLSKGDVQGAIAEYRAALEIKPHMLEAHARLALAYFRLAEDHYTRGDVDRAIEVYSKALELEPDDPYWLAAIGTAFEKKGDHPAAINEYRLASALSPFDSGLRAKYEGLLGEGQHAQGAGVALASEGKAGGDTDHTNKDVTPPVPISTPKAPYPEKARKAEYQGTVVLRIVVGVDGSVTDTEVVKPLGLGLDLQALQTVRAWKFKPGMRNGVPVAVRVTAEVTFKLMKPHSLEQWIKALGSTQSDN